MGMSHSGEQWKEFLAVVEGVEGVQYRERRGGVRTDPSDVNTWTSGSFIAVVFLEGRHDQKNSSGGWFNSTDLAMGHLRHPALPPFSNNKLITVLKSPVPPAQGGGGLWSRLQQPDANRNSRSSPSFLPLFSPPPPATCSSQDLGKVGMLKRPTSLMRRGVCKNVCM
ncbi:hypothetical protein KUCAC02_024772 [Chaenocephalus aceratus]|nr:hypothetical protein KUCAC02_024772 [Chaenocephalus aceratus]